MQHSLDRDEQCRKGMVAYVEVQVLTHNVTLRPVRLNRVTHRDALRLRGPAKLGHDKGQGISFYGYPYPSYQGHYPRGAYDATYTLP